MINAEVVLIAPVRDVESHLRDGVVHLSNLLSSVFRFHKIVIIESDSSDNTVTLAQKLFDSGLVHRFVSLGSMREMYPLRCDRIAQARNVGLSIAREDFRPDYFVFADLDGLNSTLTTEGLLSCFRYTGWAGMLANQYDRYYDIWALRHPIWCPQDCWLDYKALTRTVSPELARWICVGSRQIHIPATHAPISVESAFGGFGIYTAESVRTANWSGVTPSGSEVCEWVSFNRSVIGPIFINPQLQNSTPLEHIFAG